MPISKKTCQVIGLTECEQKTQDLLTGAAVAGGTTWETTLESRNHHEYLALRGNEEVSVLVGVRSAVADGIETMLWDRKYEGEYRARKGAKLKAYTRTLIAKISLKNHVGYVGKELRVAVCHLHFAVANKNKGFRRQNDMFWAWLANQLKEHAVHVLMGDFNMSLFKVVPELRSRGVPASLVSWFPWRSSDTGETMADSCGIFVLVPAVVTPKVSTDLFEKQWWDLPVFEVNGGPGQTLATYLPKAEDLLIKIKNSMEPVEVASKGKGKPGGDAPAVAVQTTAPPAVKGKGKGKGKVNQRQGLTVREKRLDIDTWMYKGDNHKGSHFPLAAFTNNVGRRSDDRYVARQQRIR